MNNILGIGEKVKKLLQLSKMGDVYNMFTKAIHDNEIQVKLQISRK